MTIPIRPGPFSFLEKLGQAGGAAFESAERNRQQKLVEAQDRARQYIALRAAGLMRPEEFEKPEVQSVFQMAGYGTPSSELTSAEQTERTTRRFNQPDVPAWNLPLSSMIAGAQDVTVPAQGPHSVTDEQRMAANLPARSGVTGERVQQGRGQAQLSAQAAGGAAGRQVNQVPNEQVAVAAESGPVREAFTAEAPGFVALATRGSKLENVSPAQFDGFVEAAYQTYVQDAQANNQAVLPEAQARRYFAAALQNAINEAERARTARIGASTRSSINDRELTDRDREIDNFRQQATAARQRMQTYLGQLPRGITVGMIDASPELRQLYGGIVDQVRNEQAVVETIERMLNDAQGQYRGGVDARYPTRESGWDRSLTSRRQAYDEAEAWFRAGNVDPEFPRQPGESTEQYIRRALGTRP